MPPLPSSTLLLASSRTSSSSSSSLTGRRTLNNLSSLAPGIRKRHLVQYPSCCTSPSRLSRQFIGGSRQRLRAAHYHSFSRASSLYANNLIMSSNDGKEPVNANRSSSTQAHYQDHTAQSYESAYFYSPGPYMDHLQHLVVRRLGLEAATCRTLLDVGGGTGNFTSLIMKDSPEVNAIVLDPFLEKSQQDADAQIQFIKEPAESLKYDKDASDDSERLKYHQVLMKEVVHHLDAADRADIFAGIVQDLPQKPSCDPSLLIMTRPQWDVDYPLWPAALKVWAANQPSHDTLRQELLRAGFSQVTFTLERYPCQISLEAWKQMVRGRFWSTFANFTDEELEAACVNMPIQEQDRLDESTGMLHFEDRLLFISAYK